MVELNQLERVPGFFIAVLEALQLRGAETLGLWELTDAKWQESSRLCDLAHLTLPLMRPAGMMLRVGYCREPSETSLITGCG